MSFGDWLKKILRGKARFANTVRYLDAESGKIVNIPASELRPGTVQMELMNADGTAQVVWIDADQLHPNEIQHGEFDEGVHDFIREIQTAFAEHRPISFEEWEEGFRRDGDPMREIAMWSHAANVYNAFAENESEPERRSDIYRCIVACLTSGPDDVWRVLRPEVLSRAEAQGVVNGFFGRQG